MAKMSRISRLSAAMRAAKLSAMLITHPADVRWLSGFTGSNAAIAVLMGAKGARAHLFTDGRYTQQAREEVKGMRITIAKKSLVTLALECLVAEGTTRCAFDALNTSVAALESMRKAIPAKLRRSYFQPVSGMLARLREVKDADEIVKMRAAASLGCRLYEEMLGVLQVGMTEIDAAAELEYCARKAGAEAMSFETIVASGVRGTLPHGRASSKRMAAGEMVTLDFGVILDGYCSDMTRTVYMGGASRFRKNEAVQRGVFDAVLAAQEYAVQAVAPGMTCGEVDEAARAVLRTLGLEKEFSHSTGHGVGLEIHEGPRIAAKQTARLEPGMVITVEPGAYLPQKFGVRIEDMVLVTETGYEVLTATPKAWTEL